MRPDDLPATKRSQARDAARRYRVANLRIFSPARDGTGREDQGLDLLADLLPGATRFELRGLRDELELLLGVPVDLLTPAELPPTIQARVLAQAKPL